ncbi:helix-turn-helix transcriptional regulator [Ningiella sp. W23]|uniref:helix-turn-helix transcriptional regulator n=1 Tax=Ningiella sp. W23 TaxID=3023715 RepID=UPI0037578F6F
MKHIQRYVAALKKVESQQGLDAFLTMVSERNSYLWSGLVVNSHAASLIKKTDMYGAIPSQVKDWLVLDPVFDAQEGADFFPKTATASEIETLSVGTELGGVLLLPFIGLGSERGFVIFGLKGEAYQQILPKLEQVGWYWSIVLPYIYDAYCRVFKCEKPHITKREMECISWASEGKTSWEIGRILDITERTVNFHLNNCIHKTDSVNRQQAIAKCLLQGYF